MSVFLLVRHGQASFGAADYDRLSPLGVRQSVALGGELARQGVRPQAIVTGRMRRHAETVSAVRDSAGWTHEAQVDPAWDEFDVNAFLPGGLDGKQSTNSRDFQQVLDAAMRDWAEGLVELGHGESFAAFTARVETGLQRLAAEPSPSGPIVVSTSAGALSWAVTSLLGGGVEHWIRLNRVCINAAVTKIVSGRSGISLVSFNEHGHLAGDEITYR